MIVKPWPHVVLSGKRLSGIEARAILEVLDLAGEVLFGRFDAALRTLACDLTRRIDPAQVETVARLLEQASQALHPGRPSLRDDELSEFGLLVERLRRLADDDHTGYEQYHQLLRQRYKARLARDRERRQEARS